MLATALELPPPVPLSSASNTLNKHPTAQPEQVTRRTAWQRRIRDPIAQQLTRGTTPHEIALTLGLGTACGLFPFLGFTTLLCFVIALILKLNQPIIHVVNQLLWPIHVPMMLVYMRSGAWLLGSEVVAYEPKNLAHLFLHSQHEFWHHIGLASAYAFLAWTLSVPVIVICIYYSTRPVLQKFARRTTH